MDSLLQRYTTIMLLSVGLVVNPAQAQVIPDGSLPTVVSSLDNINFAIELGSRNGMNLFHSFSQFSIPTGGSAVFKHPTDVQNIFSRVTGGTGSNIDGLIQAQGGASLFLLNPNGIVFGPNATLNIGGSFLGTTASRIQFADGVAFDAMNPTPLLSVSVPIGLQMGSNPGSIQVNGNGHRLVSPSTTITPYFPTGPIGGLNVQTGKTLALVGGSINLLGGGLTAEGGRVEIGSLGSSETVALETGSPRWIFNYDATQRFSDIMLSGRSIVDVSGIGAGSIQVQGQRVSLTDGSVLFVQNRGVTPAGDIQIRADSLNVVGGFAGGNIRSSVINETLLGNSGNISVTARQINLIDGGSLFSRSFGIGSSGNIDINARESFKIAGFLLENPELASAIGTISFSPLLTGGSGMITISTPTLSLAQGGLISATTFGNAAAGNVNITADRIDVADRNPNFFPSTISSSTFGLGNAGSISINTRSLELRNEGSINTASYSNGDAGSLTINSSESIEVGKQSNISSGVSPNSPAVTAALNLPLQPRGNAGSVMITSPIVTVRDQGLIVVSNTGLGNSGKVSIAATQIMLDQQAQITAATQSGVGGDVILKSQSLVLRQGSAITATAGGSSNGGNIAIDVPVIAGLGNSDIIANAVKGRGGNIQITTQGIFGFKYRDRLTSENDITASSEFGVNGTVQVNTIGINPNSGLTALPVDTINSSQKIANGCSTKNNSRFVATGRGGIPETPTQILEGDRTWSDLRMMTDAKNGPSRTAAITPIEATALAINAQGQMELVGERAIPSNPMGVTCSKQESLSSRIWAQ
jgi:filamentous hemagglutinin family protein